MNPSLWRLLLRRVVAALCGVDDAGVVTAIGLREDRPELSALPWWDLSARALRAPDARAGVS